MTKTRERFQRATASGGETQQMLVTLVVFRKQLVFTMRV